MDDLKEQYEKVLKDKVDTIHEIYELSKDVKVKKYLGLSTKKECLIRKEEELYEKIKLQEYDNCKHIFVYSKIDHNHFEGKTACYLGCIKCGLTDETIENHYSLYQPRDERIMANYLFNNRLKFDGEQLKITCNAKLAHAIYKKIKEVHPNIDDKTAVKYFEIALDNIQNIEVSEERKKSRAKRLSLGVNFNQW